MSYSAEISRANPACFLFLIDQSTSMSDAFGGSEGQSSKAEEVALATNRIFQELVAKCSAGMEVRRYFQIGVLGYGGSVGPILGGGLSGQTFVWIDELANNPIRIDEHIRKQSDGAGGLIDVPYKLPVWFDAVANGGTPMVEAFRQAKSMIQSWVVNCPNAYPPIVINITDGESTDGDPSSLANEIHQMATQDGNVLLLNIHLSSVRARPISFPSNEEVLPADPYARLLFHMSSLLPPGMREEAQRLNYQTTNQSRGFVFNARLEDLISFLIIGTKASNLR